MTHYGEDDLVLYYYGEARRRPTIERHLDECPTCSATYRALCDTLRMLDGAEPPQRSEQYGLEVWQRIRHQLPEREPWWAALRWNRLALVGTALALVATAFVAGRLWPDRAVPPSPAPNTAAAGARERILLASVADHLDRSDRMLTEIMNAPEDADMSAERQWAEDLLTSSRLYRQDAAEAGDQSVASVLDELERCLLEIVHSPSPITAANLEQLRRRIDAAALLFKVRVMSDELRRRDTPPALRHTT